MTIGLVENLQMCIVGN